MSGPSQPIFRFAPSPNGYLHIGHAFSALFTHHWADALGGVMLLRIEDIDTARCRPEFVDALLEDLAWLGLSWPEPVRRQSEHFDDYARAAKTLREQGLLYPCFCSRAEIRAAAGESTDPEGAPLYPGTCRGLGPTGRAERLASGAPVQWRLDMERAIAAAGPLLIRETQPDPSAPLTVRPADPARWGDVVIVRKDTPASYHLSVVVDDALQGITHVTRGMDLHASTDIHVLLQALLGLPSPVYCHHELVLDEAREKLAKSKGSESLRALRAAGWTAVRVRKELGF
ncbi:tRNA glutamyl-Q(34) synthetase GluQRS [Pelagibacterium sediminicola]|uniref:tRNA glutamyl-Q(34) synthetase GluQRS n=1 Tax=Pelagibacterium sediminicola TaxID=2248761 RepID=UPI000E314F36|nr:tRNA glutamyl-Q(34) synthetase GluQRS [Pelagibacterium sediminicola]